VIAAVWGAGVVPLLLNPCEAIVVRTPNALALDASRIDTPSDGPCRLLVPLSEALDRADGRSSAAPFPGERYLAELVVGNRAADLVPGRSGAVGVALPAWTPESRLDLVQKLVTSRSQSEPGLTRDSAAQHSTDSEPGPRVPGLLLSVLERIAAIRGEPARCAIGP
jgi:hypothetical protein